MGPGERLQLARAAYEEALARARADSTPSSWRRALTAARNLGSARRDAEQGRGRRNAPSRESASPRGGSIVHLAEPHAPWTPAADGWRFDASPPTSWGCWRLDRSPELAAEWERSKALMARSRRLIDQARELCLAIRQVKR